MISKHDLILGRVPPEPRRRACKTGRDPFGRYDSYDLGNIWVYRNKTEYPVFSVLNADPNFMRMMLVIGTPILITYGRS